MMANPDHEGQIGPYRYEAVYKSPEYRPDYIRALIWRDGKLVRSVDRAGPRAHLKTYHTFRDIDALRRSLWHRVRRERVPAKRVWSPRKHPCHRERQRKREEEREEMRRRDKVMTEHVGGRTLNRIADEIDLLYK